jgi:A/G-specific adenine glycosylase
MKRVVTAGIDAAPLAKAGRENFLARDDTLFSSAVIRWQKQHGRHALPWQNTREPYRVWLSEIMLQQTQVTAVIPYYLRFLERFPDLVALASARQEEVMSHWSGLGYYSRARNLHKCAQHVVAEYAGVFPADPALLAELPGIGRSTAAAIAAFSYGARAAILDGNVKRVFARVFGIGGYPGDKKIEQDLWQRAEALMPRRDVEAYTQGLMDLGATVCTRTKPLCKSCPLSDRCVALASDRVSELPVRKPKRAVPEKHAAMLVLLHQGQVLLEQRPNLGIWGGLLSLPEIQMNQNEREFESGFLNAVSVFGVLDHYRRLPSISHGFTHFKLYISPYQVHLKRRLDSVRQKDHVWYDLDRLQNAPLPAPIKKLLLHIRQDS